MKESQIQTEFSKVCRMPGCFELKIVKTSSMPYGAVKPHQIDALLLAKGSGLFHKITDQPWLKNRKAYTLKKPFDCFFVQNYPAYVGICFYEPRKPRELILIDIDDFVKARDTDTRKSLTKEKALSIASHIIKLKHH